MMEAALSLGTAMILFSWFMVWFGLVFIRYLNLSFVRLLTARITYNPISGVRNLNENEHPENYMSTVPLTGGLCLLVVAKILYHYMRCCFILTFCQKNYIDRHERISEYGHHIQKSVVFRINWYKASTRYAERIWGMWPNGCFTLNSILVL